MLGNECGHWQWRMDAGENLRKCLRPSGAAGDEESLGPEVAAPRLRRQGRRRNAGAPRLRLRRGLAPFLADSGGGQQLVMQKGGAPRFGHEVDGPKRQGIQCDLGARFGQRTAHDDACRRLRRKLFQCFDPALNRHLHIEGDDGGMQLQRQLDALPPVAGGAHDGEARVRVDFARKRLPHEGQVVDHKDADLIVQRKTPSSQANDFDSFLGRFCGACGRIALRL